ncbi:MAG: hypothetical protein R3C04_00440 [Hyphomonas sp.]
MRRAIVEREIVKTELDQTKEEVERLYAAQRGTVGQGVMPQLRTPRPARLQRRRRS